MYKYIVLDVVIQYIELHSLWMQHWLGRGNLGDRVGGGPPNYDIGWAANTCTFCPPNILDIGLYR